MLLVPNYLKESSIHGVGLYTAVDIPAGTLIWEFTPGIDWELDEHAFDKMAEPYRSQLRSYAFVPRPGVLILCGDNGRFMNHSFEPSCDDANFVTRALRDIAKDEELTCDYRTFDLESRESGLAEWAPRAAE